MKIVMLGLSNAGKTTYIAMMYELMRKGYGGFKIRATEPDRDRELLSAARSIRQGTYPPPSSRRDAHVFRLSHRRRAVADFTWTDYRGGALTDRARDEETAQVLAEISGADGLVVFVDAHNLATTAGSGRRAVRRLTVLLQRAVDERPGKVPVVVAYTKADLVAGDQEWARATAPLADLQQALATSHRVLDTTVAVSCGADPAGVHVPVLWCLAQHLSARVTDLERELAASRSLMAGAKERSGVWNSLTSTIKGEESEWQKYLRYEQGAKEEAKELKPLRAPARRLLVALERAQADHAPPTGQLAQEGR
ncbi:hypothetical protein [Streptomyces sp. NPDC002889]|uniref:TRAFAC clade GTPase domain-containing protein n=1 Tax=Streptomyces sp. NPDC002889 TaxID=3364669 RepID=UPI0036C2CE08